MISERRDPGYSRRSPTMHGLDTSPAGCSGVVPGTGTANIEFLQTSCPPCLLRRTWKARGIFYNLMILAKYSGPKDLTFDRRSKSSFSRRLRG